MSPESLFYLTWTHCKHQTTQYLRIASVVNQVKGGGWIEVSRCIFSLTLCWHNCNGWNNGAGGGTTTVCVTVADLLLFGLNDLLQAFVRLVMACCYRTLPLVGLDWWWNRTATRKSVVCRVVGWRSRQGETFWTQVTVFWWRLCYDAMNAAIMQMCCS